jgi:hypothetical protein
MTMHEATTALIVPAHRANDNCVRDAQWRLRDAIKLANLAGWEKAPSYVVAAVDALKSWL